MAGTLFWLNTIQVFIGAEDHPPPHVHAFHSREGWTARFRFSFLSDVVGLYRFRRRGRKTTLSTLDEIGSEVERRLNLCREVWWTTHGADRGIGLVSRRAKLRAIPTGDQVLVKVALAPADTATIIKSASYSPKNCKIGLTLENGIRLSLSAGQHIEEAKEWL
jgi:hypothetical protein